MIAGSVQNGQAVVAVVYHIPGLGSISHDHVIDTGFSGDLTLPRDVVERLRLAYDRDQEIRLANDALDLVPVHLAMIEIGGNVREATVFSTGNRPLFGTGLMEGKELVIQFVEGGMATLDDI